MTETYLKRGSLLLALFNATNSCGPGRSHVPLRPAPLCLQLATIFDSFYAVWTEREDSRSEEFLGIVLGLD
jgi:hypothetical protein